MKLNEMTNQTIMSKLQATNKFEWLSVENAQMLDYEFYLTHSGEKEVAPIIEILLNKGKTEDEVLDIITNILVTKYASKWNRIYDTLLDDKYDAFDDYSKERNIDTSTNQDVTSKVNSNSNAKSDDTNSVYAFNSEDEVPNNSSHSTSNNISSSSTNVIADKTQNTGNSKEITMGKLGGTSYQDLARKEVNLRLEHNLLDIVFKDISNEMCLSIYC